MRANRAVIILLVVLTLVFVVGVNRLFSLRFEAGDVYPPYSSLRTDPLGAKALFESLEALSGFSAQRNYRPISKLVDGTTQTIIFLGCRPTEVTHVPESEAKEIEALALSGDRIVVSVLPVLSKPEHRKSKESKVAKDNEAEEERFISLEERWGFELAYNSKATNNLWHTLLYFDKLDPKWQTLASRQTYPAIIERRFGKGAIVLCADSYFISNEAMRHDRQPELLAQLVGSNRNIVFDEVHLGVANQPGVMTLARKYRLHGLIAGLLLLAGLFIWKNVCSFIPPHEDALANTATGKDSAAGFNNLLRRSIPAAQVLEVCVAEWKKSFAHTQRRAPQKVQRIEAIVAGQAALPARQRNPVAGYHAIAGILKERK